METLPPCLLWDVDGTLTDTTALICDALEHVYLKYYGQTLPYDERRALIGTPLKAQVRVFGEPETFGTDAETVMRDFIAFYEANGHRERILTEVIAILREGRQRGLPTALITSKNIPELTNTLPRLGIADVIDFAITADDVRRPKPAPDGILLALERFKIPADLAPRACYIGDTVHDMRAARDAAVRGAGVLWGAATRTQLEAQSPAIICETPADLRAFLFPGSE